MLTNMITGTNHSWYMHNNDISLDGLMDIYQFVKYFIIQISQHLNSNYLSKKILRYAFLTLQTILTDLSFIQIKQPESTWYTIRQYIAYSTLCLSMHIKQWEKEDFSVHRKEMSLYYKNDYMRGNALIIQTSIQMWQIYADSHF